MALRIDQENGQIEGARQVPSPNCDARPPGVEPDLLVVHAISLPPGEFGGDHIDRLFTNRLNPAAHPFFATIGDARVSAHALIRRDGAIVQYVPLHQRAWHAGESCYADRNACNDYSIGIELEGPEEGPFTGAQYARLGQLAAALCVAYPGVTPHRMVGHCDISPGRKIDPGADFDWARVHAEMDLARGAAHCPGRTTA